MTYDLTKKIAEFLFCVIKPNSCQLMHALALMFLIPLRQFGIIFTYGDMIYMCVQIIPFLSLKISELGLTLLNPLLIFECINNDLFIHKIITCSRHNIFINQARMTCTCINK